MTIMLADPPLEILTCEVCDGYGYTCHRVTVYEPGCGFPHDDTDERACEECDGFGEWITESNGDDDMDGCGVCDTMADEVVLLRSENKRLRDLVQTLLNNDPREPIADNGMTVLDGWRDSARRALGE